MKLKQIIITACAAVFCVSCSNDSDFPGGKKPSGDATLSVAVKASGFTQKTSKADANALAGELNINNLTAIVFDQTGNSLLGDPVRTTTVATTEGITTLTGIPVKAVIGQLLLIANAPDNLLTDLTTLTALQTKLAMLDDQTQTNLLMSSRLITTKQKFIDGENYIGFEDQSNVDDLNKPVELTRVPARVEVVSVTADLAGSPIAGRTIQVNRVFLQDMRTSSYLFSADYWGAVMFKDLNNLKSSTSVDIEQPVNDNLSISGTPYRRYVMENTDQDRPTKVVVVATILANDEYLEQTKAFSAVINPNGLTNGYDHNFVKRNYIYRLTVNFSGNSFSPVPPPTPETGDLDVKVEVVGWGPVDQSVEIE